MPINIIPFDDPKTPEKTTQQATRPSKYESIDFKPPPSLPETKDQFITAISSYFTYCKTNFKPPSFTGLATVLGLTRLQLKNIAPNTDTEKIIFSAKQLIIQIQEEELLESNKPSAGKIFWLKNCDDWVDKSEVKLSTTKTMSDVLDELEKEQEKQPIIEGETTPVEENQ